MDIVNKDGELFQVPNGETADQINFLGYVINQWNNHVGWWHENSNSGEKMMLMVSEIAEAMEADRKDKNDDHLPNRKGVEVELADAIIRILDYSAQKKLDVGGALVEKFMYNMDRADHKKEARAKAGGKKY